MAGINRHHVDRRTRIVLNCVVRDGCSRPLHRYAVSAAVDDGVICHCVIEYAAQRDTGVNNAIGRSIPIPSHVFADCLPNHVILNGDIFANGCIFKHTISPAHTGNSGSAVARNRITTVGRCATNHIRRPTLKQNPVMTIADYSLTVRT